MPWRKEKKLSDFDRDTEFEVRCIKCKRHRYESARDLTGMARLGHLYVDELQAILNCGDRHCGGQVRVQVMHDKLHEPFVAGMP